MSYQLTIEAFIQALENVVTYITSLVTAAGNTVLVTPSSGHRIRVHYLAYSNKHTIAADVAMRFGTTGNLTHRHVLAAEGGNINANLIHSNWEGNADEPLYAYLDAAYADGVYFTVGYTEEA